MTLTRTLLAALAATALAAPTALAQPGAPGGNAARLFPTRHTQDLRSPDAIDAATRPGAITQPLPGPPSWPLHPRPITTPTTTTDHGVDGTTIGLGIAGSLLAAGGIAGIGRRSRRTRRQRVAA